MGNWKKKKTQSSSSSGNQLYSLSPNQSYGRNLSKEQLDGVIFGTKNTTIKECLTKQLFGLPAQHFSYVKNIRPGLPLFLFNYTDRTLHGIFEAASPGRMLIDRYGWSADGTEETRFPAQVQTRVQLHCRPLAEDVFKPAIADNYYHDNHFWFELDHGQTSQLVALLKRLEITPANSVRQNTNRVTVSRPLPRHNSFWKVKTFQKPESELEEHHSTRSSMKPGSNESDLLEERCQPFDTHTIDKEEETQNERDHVLMKLKELAVGCENQNRSRENNVCGTSYENCSEGKHSKENEEIPSSPSKKEENSIREHQYDIDQLVQELTDFKKTQAERNNYLEQKLIKAELEIQLLKDRCILLESTRS